MSLSLKLMSFFSLLILSGIQAEAKRKSKTDFLAKSPRFSSTLEFSSVPEKLYQEKIFHVMWPKGITAKTLVFLETSITPVGKVDNSFSIKSSLPSKLEKNQAFDLSIHFTPTLDFLLEKRPTLYQSILTISGFQEKTGQKVILARVLLVGHSNKEEEPTLDCQSMGGISLTPHSMVDSFNLARCQNKGPKILKLSQLQWTCTSPLISIIPNSSVELKKDEQTVLHAKITISNLSPGNYSCSFFGRSNDPKQPRFEIKTSIQLISSPFFITVYSFKKDFVPEKLSQTNPKGDYIFNIPSVFPGTTENIYFNLNIIESLSVHISVKDLQIHISGDDHSAFQTKVQKKVDIFDATESWIGTFSFTPQTLKQQHQALAVLDITYEDSTHLLRKEQIVIQLQSSFVVKDEITLPEKKIDILDVLPDDCKNLLFPKGTFWTLSPEDGKAKNCFSLDQVSSPYPRWVSIIRHKKIDIYKQSNDKNFSWEKSVLPMTLRYRPLPLGLNTSVQLTPGVDLFGKFALFQARFDISKQWKYPLEAGIFLPEKKLSNHIGGEFLVGSRFDHLSYVSDGLWSQIPVIGLGLFYQGGGDLLDHQKLGLYFHTGLGYLYTQATPLQEQQVLIHQFYLDHGLELRIHPIEKMPGFHINIRPLIRAAFPSKNVTFEIPLGVGVEL